MGFLPFCNSWLLSSKPSKDRDNAGLLSAFAFCPCKSVKAAESNNDLINYYLNCFYKTRKKACDDINSKFGLDIEIKLNKDILDLLKVTENDIINYDNEDNTDVSVGDKNE